MTAPSFQQTTFDLCVIGGGPAGIILSLEYARKNPAAAVVLVEFGTKGQPPTNTLDDRIEVTNLVNHHPPYECTNKGLGGSSATWGGRCVPYDEVDFLDRPILKGGCTWDLALYHEVCTYLERAAEYFECGTPSFRSQSGTRLAEGFREDEVIDSALERWSMPTRFGDRYARELRSLPNLTIREGYEAREFLVDAQGRAYALRLRQAGGQAEDLRAVAFAIAAGGQETTRLLLRNPALFASIGGPSPALGKFYQGHLSGKIASVQFFGDPRKTEYGFELDEQGVYSRRRFQFTKDFLVRENLLNTAIWLDNPLYHDPAHRSGALSFMYLAMLMPVLGKRLAPPAIAHSITKGKKNRISAHVRNVVTGLPRSLWVPASIFFRRYCLKRKLPGVFLSNAQNRYALHFHAEQVPDPANRMELDADGETLRIHYDFTEADVQSVIALHRKLDDWLRQCGCGQLQYWYEPDQLPDAIRAMSRDGLHQVGTTRMADSPRQGVVDRNLKVWGTSNVYVCSSSAFPTSGQANPTFFLGAFAVRLAHYLSTHATR
jgi:choline dehydrogenase-like flavoprotein